MKDESWLVDAILEGKEKDRKAAIEFLYDKCFKSFRKLVERKGTIEQSEDLFQEGLSIMYKNIITGKFRNESKLSTYLISICKNLWLLELRSKKQFVEIDELSIDVDQDELKVDSEVLKLFQNMLKADCKKILESFYYQQSTMKEIMTQFNLGSEQAAKTKKMRCLKRLMEMVKEKGLTYDNFLK